MAGKRKKTKKRSGWNGRLAGLALCAFFALGVFTGLSGSGRRLAKRVEAALHLAPGAADAPIAPAAPVPSRGADATIALVERGDGFYALDATGGLRGPVAPGGEGDMPILSGAALATASADRLLDYASVLVRAEAGLGMTVSEMRVDTEDGATLYLDRPPLGITIDFANTADEIERAARVLGLWRGHRELLAALDVTVPGQAVARLRPAAFEALGRSPKTHARLIRVRAAGRPRSFSPGSSPEVTASR